MSGVERANVWDPPSCAGQAMPEAGLRGSRELGAVLKARLPAWFYALLRAARGVAEAEGTCAYLVGGFVRDLLLGQENLDVDLVVEGDGIAYAERLAQRLGGRCARHRTFGTAAVTLPNGFKLDVATARTERYAHPGALPSVAPGSIQTDLARRDFTINAMAIALDRARWGQLLDRFDGQRDLRARRIRVLHAQSFVDDPTRILRAARFAVRYGFRLGRPERRLAAEALGLGLLDRVSGGRILNELHLIADERDPLGILRRLQALGVLRAIHPALEPPRGARHLLRRLPGAWARRGAAGPAARVERRHLWLLALLADRRSAEVRAAARRLQPPPRDAARLLEDAADVRRLRRALGRRRGSPPSAVARLLRGASPEVLLFLMASADRKDVRAALEDYRTRSAQLKPALTGRDLQALGIRPGPVYRAILDALRDARLDGRVRTREDEVTLVRRRFRRAMSSEQ